MLGGRGSRALVAVTLALLELAHPLPGRAQTKPERKKVPLTLAYTAPGNCPTASDFRASIEARTELAEFGGDPTEAEVVQVTIRATGSTYAGHLFMAPLEGAMSTRDVQDVRCADVVDALALVTALAIDPNAALSPPPAPPPPPPPPIPDAPSMPPHFEPTVVTLVTDAPQPLVPVTPQVRLLFAPPGDEPDALSSHAPLVWRVNAGTDAMVQGGVARDVMLGGGAFAELASEGGGVWVPSVRVSFFAASNGVFEARDAAVTLLEARVTGCPLRFGTKRLSLSPCGAVDAGGLVVAGANADRPVTATVPWVALDAVARLRWEPWKGRSLFLEAEGGAAFPLTRAQFVYELPNTDDVFRPGAVAPVASLGGGLRFR